MHGPKLKFRSGASLGEYPTGYTRIPSTRVCCVHVCRTLVPTFRHFGICEQFSIGMFITTIWFPSILRKSQTTSQTYPPALCRRVKCVYLSGDNEPQPEIVIFDKLEECPHIRHCRNFDSVRIRIDKVRILAPCTCGPEYLLYIKSVL